MAAARPDTWMPLYWGDYIKATRHLTAAEHGAYLLLIGHYWVTGEPLPNDDQRLSRIAGMTAKEWAKHSPVIKKFFSVDLSTWRHKRVEEELAKSKQITQAKAEAGRKGSQTRWQTKSKGIAEPLAKPSQKAWQNDAQSQSPILQHEEKGRGSGTSVGDLGDPPFGEAA